MAIAFIRTIILYLLLTVGIRIMGKKQVGELETVELVFTMLISDLAAVPMQDFGIPLAYGLIPILTLFSLTMLLSVLSLKSVPLRSLLCGRPSVIIDHGVILQREMAKPASPWTSCWKNCACKASPICPQWNTLFWRTPDKSPSFSTLSTSP